MGEPRMFLDGRVALHGGDCLDVLRGLADNSIDAVNMDPPYFLTSITDRFGRAGSAPAQFGSDGAFKRLSGGFMSKLWDAPEAPAIDPHFGNYMAGFIDGEGCFSVHKKQVNGCETFDCQFAITVRSDDKPILESMRSALGGIGSMADRPSRVKNAGPQARWCVSSKADCMRLRAVLTAFPLRAKKARDFQIWCHALDLWVSHTPGSGWDDIAYYRDALMAVRAMGSVHRPERLFFYRVGRELLRVLKPGGHLVSFSGTRTYHHMVAGLDDAGFEIRDQLAWIYGTGFPKNHSVSNGLTKKGLVDEAMEWDGWGTALKPAFEPICLARKPVEGTVAENCLKWGTGALNVGASRIGTDSVSTQIRALDAIHGGALGDPAVVAARRGLETTISDPRVGRYPANIVHDGSAEVAACFPTIDDVSAARFFYSAKADGDDRHGLNHPTIKPVDLMRWLARLTCRKGGTILDPFAGTGTTAEAAYWEGCNAVLVEREEEYQAAIAIRMGLVLAGPDEKKRARTKLAAAEGLPLFGSSDDKSQSDSA